MFVDLGGEDVVVLELPVDGDWSGGASRTVRTIAPPEPQLPDGTVTAAEGWRLFLPAGDPISRAARVKVRGRTYAVHSQPEVWADTCVVVQVVTGARSALITLRRPATTDWDAENEITTTTVPAETYASSLAAGIQAQVNRSDNDAVSAEETLAEQPYVVTIDQDVAPAEGDEVEVTACPEDLSLVGRTLLIQHVVRGTERFERQLLCTLVDVP